MSRKMLINASEPEEVRVAVVEGSILEEYYVERLSVESVLGNIYKGRVTNVEPSIGAAFVDIGGSRHGFLHVTDVMEEPLLERLERLEKPAEGEATEGEEPPRGENGGGSAQEAEAGTAAGEAEAVSSSESGGEGETEPEPSREEAEAVQEAAGSTRRRRAISDYVTKGQEVIVQVTKDGIGTKGPTLTTYLSLPGRYLVLMPGIDKKGISRKISDPKERARLAKVVDQLEARPGLGFIVRTAGVGQSLRALKKDYDYLVKLFDQVVEKARSLEAPAELYRESDLVIRSIRDIYVPDMGDIIIDDEDCARRAREFLGMVMPRSVKRVKLYTGARPLFLAFGVEDEIARLFLHRVELPSGGSLVIEQTEALVAIDVNSGRFREEEDLEETAYRINLEAAEAVARQLRLRDLGGVIVVDFIDMLAERRRRAVERAFKQALRADRSRIKVARMSPFGTIELTRQRVRPSLRHSIFQRCPECRGMGYVATQETFLLNLVRHLKAVLARQNAGVEVFCNLANLEYLVNRKWSRIKDLEQKTGKRVVVRVEPELRTDEFRVVPMDAKRAANW